MVLAQKYKVNTPKVVSEMIDGEVVVVNLDKGDYYSLVQSGAEIWESLVQGNSPSQIVEEMLQNYNGEPSQIEAAIHDFLDKLHYEELIVPQSTEPLSTEVQPNLSSQNASHSEKQIFEIPTLQKYTDMEELLALDPIHEVDEMGWPHVKQ